MFCEILYLEEKYAGDKEKEAVLESLDTSSKGVSFRYDEDFVNHFSFLPTANETK